MSDESKATYWSGLVEEHAASGKTLAAFARERGVQECTLRYWRNKFGRGPEPRALVGGTQFVKLVPNTRPGEVRVAVGGVEISSECYPDPEWVASLVQRLTRVRP